MTNETGNLTMISANGGLTICPHGSIYCRRCYGEKISKFNKNHESHKTKKKTEK